MRVRYLGGQFEGEFMLTKGKEYGCLGIEGSWYRVIDNEGEDYLYPAREFEVVYTAEEML